jgi:ubiquitin-conjugating enzyme E2 N
MSSKHIRLLKDLVLVDETFKTEHLFNIKKKIDASTNDAVHETDLTHPIFVYTPQQSPYIGGEFELEISLPLDYPLTTPRVKFRTPIYSPIIDESGTLSCLPILQRWQSHPINSIHFQDILNEIDYYITHLEDVDEPHRPALLTEWNEDPVLFTKTAENQTKELAKPQKR